MTYFSDRILQIGITDEINKQNLSFFRHKIFANIFKAIAKPDSGFSELFTNVSQKMSSKISSGELSQEAIMKDAMKFASILPGLFGGNSEDNSSGGGGFDMSTMMNMMSMMKNMNGGGGNGGGGAKTRSGVNNQALRNLMKKQQLKQKLNSNN
jgi:hypothetical protein